MAAKVKMHMAKKNSRRVVFSKDIPVTLGMLHMVRDELKSSISSLEHKMDSKFGGMESRFAGMDSRLHQMQLMMEEQNARNRIVMDGLTSLFARQERCEDRLEAAEKLLIQIRAK